MLLTNLATALMNGSNPSDLDLMDQHKKKRQMIQQKMIMMKEIERNLLLLDVKWKSVTSWVGINEKSSREIFSPPLFFSFCLFFL